MDPERWRKIDQLLSAALEAKAEERASFLARVCEGDEELHKQIQRLISAHEATSNFLEPRPSSRDTAANSTLRDEIESFLRSVKEGGSYLASTAIRASLTNQHGSMIEQRIGSYKLLREIGHGGMGVVYLAWVASSARSPFPPTLPPSVP